MVMMTGRAVAPYATNESKVKPEHARCREENGPV